MLEEGPLSSTASQARAGVFPLVDRRSKLPHAGQPVRPFAAASPPAADRRSLPAPLLRIRARSTDPAFVARRRRVPQRRLCRRRPHGHGGAVRGRRGRGRRRRAPGRGPKRGVPRAAAAVRWAATSPHSPNDSGVSRRPPLPRRCCSHPDATHAARRSAARRAGEMKCALDPSYAPYRRFCAVRAMLNSPRGGFPGRHGGFPSSMAVVPCP